MASKVIFILQFVSCLAAKISIMPHFGPSHYMVFAKLAEELINRGHQVSILVGEDAAYAFGKPAVKFFKVPLEEREANQRLVKRQLLRDGITITEILHEIMRIQKQYCDWFLSSPEMIDEVRNADVVIGEAFYPCSTLAADKFDLPHVLMKMGPISSTLLRIFGQTTELSYIPQMSSGFSPNMGLLDRVKNLGFFVGSVLFIEFVQMPVFKELKEKHNIKPTKSIHETMATVDLILLEADFALDYPRPLSPHFREVGFLLPSPAKPLPVDLEDFMQSSGDDGVVLVSFGTLLDNLSDEVIKVMSNAFSKLPQKFIWKYDYDSFKDKLTPNIKVMKWLPQNDILGHPKTKLFITHAGVNGMAEAAYHGVPMVCSPFFADQFENCKRVQEFGLGEILSVRDATTDQLVDILKNVLQDKRYKEKSGHVSTVMKKRRRTPTEEAADLIEYVQAVGDMSHLKPKGLELPLYKLYMLDVLLLIGVVVGFVLVLLVWLVKLIVRMCYRVSQKTKTS